MSTPFATLEADVQVAVAEHLANAEATFGTGGVPVSGRLTEVYAEPFGMVAGVSLAFTAPAVALAGLSRGDTITINGTGYTAAEIKPARSGAITVVLESE